MCTPGNTFTIQNGTNIVVPSVTTGSVNDVNDICTANRILDKLHNDFTEEYSPSPDAPILAGRPTRIGSADKGNPTFWLREQPALTGFTFGDYTTAESDGSSLKRFNRIFEAGKTEQDQSYRTLIYAIMTGLYNPAISITDYLNRPTGSSPLTALTDPTAFKGIYGLRDLNKILEERIKAKVSGITEDVVENTQLDKAYNYQKRKGIKTTIEEIAYQENKTYREKFLNILLLIVGVFLITTQLTQNYFSFSEGSSSSISGLGNIGGWLSSRIGFGSGGLFSRFGGVGLGSSGRSRFGNLFTGNPYSLSKRE
jgi:hypothetical protein